MSRVHRRHHEHHKRAPEPQITRTVFLTATPSFTGRIVGYTTVGVKPTPPARRPPPPDEDEEEEEKPRRPTTSSTSTKSTSTTRRSTSTSSTVEPEEETPTPTPSKTEDLINGLTSTPTTTNTISSPTSTGEASGGMSGAATAGLVGGGIAILLVLLAFAAFFYRRKQQRRMQEAYGKPEDEKVLTVNDNFREKPSYNDNGLPAHAEPPLSATSEKAPRINSFRPGSEFMPNLIAGAGAAAGAAAVTNNGHLAAKPQSRPQEQIARKPAPLTLAQSNFEQKQHEQPQYGQQGPPPPVIIPAAQNSPAQSTFSDAPGTPIAGGAAAGAPQMQVFRVTMDFKPTMADELELRSGELVRLMHEYDDGWALCSRMDRSQQGVCPRTCLSQRPVKPRPRPGPGPHNQGPGGPQQQQRNGPPPRPYPAGPQSRPGTPQQNGRPQTPNTGYSSRPQTPVQQQQRVATPQNSPPKIVTAHHIIPEITVSPVDDSPPISLSRPQTPRQPGQVREHSPLAQPNQQQQ